MKELEDLLADLQQKTFSGESDYYAQHPGCHLRFTYSLGKLTVDNKALLGHAISEVGLDAERGVSSLVETLDGVRKEYTSKEIADLAGYNMLRGRCLHHDPRYALFVAEDIKKLGEGHYDMRIWEDNLFGKKIQVRAELLFDDRALKSMTTRKLAGKKEIPGQTYTIMFA